MLDKIRNCTCANTWGDVAPLILRIALGAIFAWHGFDKVFTKGMPAVSGFLGSLGFPAPGIFAYLLAYGELIGGVLLILGLCTHWVSKYLAFIALVAFFTVHISKGFAVSGGGYEFIMLIFASAVSLMISGSGKYSLDAKMKAK